MINTHIQDVGSLKNWALTSGKWYRDGSFSHRPAYAGIVTLYVFTTFTRRYAPLTKRDPPGQTKMGQHNQETEE